MAPDGTHPSGWNPLRWDCEKQGCFNILKRPKIEIFADCFPGKINYGDVDGEVEIKGFFNQLEWKSGNSGHIPTGQRIKFEKYTRSKNGNIIFVVEGNAETMEISRFCYFWNGKQKPWQAGGVSELKCLIRKWVRHAQRRDSEVVT